MKLEKNTIIAGRLRVKGELVPNPEYAEEVKLKKAKEKILKLKEKDGDTK